MRWRNGRQRNPHAHLAAYVSRVVNSHFEYPSDERMEVLRKLFREVSSQKEVVEDVGGNPSCPGVVNNTSSSCSSLCQADVDQTGFLSVQGLGKLVEELFSGSRVIGTMGGFKHVGRKVSHLYAQRIMDQIDNE